MEKFEPAPFILDIFSYPWGVIIIDSDGIYCGISVWINGDDQTCHFAVGHEDEIRAMLPN